MAAACLQFDVSHKTIILPDGSGNNGHEAAYRLTLMVPKRRYFSYLRERWWVVLVAVALALGAITAYETVRPESYVSIAQLYASGEVQLNGANIFSEDPQTYYGTQIELLKSARLQQAALERIGYTPKPDNKLPIALEVVQPLKTSILVLEATCLDPHLAQQFLQALVDEYLNYKKETRRSTSQDVMLSITEQLAVKEKELKDEQDRWVDFQKTNNVAVLEEESKSAGLYLADLNLQVAKLRLDRDLLVQGLVPDTLAAASRAGAVAGSHTNFLDRQTTNAATAQPALFSDSSSDTALKSAQVELVVRRAEHDQVRKEHGEIAARRLDEEVQRLERAVAALEEQNLAERRVHIDQLERRITAIETSIPSWQSRVLTMNERLSESQKLKNNIQREMGFYDHLLGTLQTVDLSKNVQQERVSVLQPATVARPINRYLTLRLAMAMVTAVGVGLAMVFSWYLIDDRFVSAGDVRDQFGETILGLVPEIKTGRSRPGDALLKHLDPRREYAEAYRHLRSALLLSALGGERPQTLLITGAAPTEGKSTIAANLARVLARSGLRVVLVDADTRAQGVGRLLESNGRPGVLDYLRGGAGLGDIVHPTDVPGLMLVPAGTHTEQTEGAFLQPELASLLSRLKTQGDFVIIDAAPILGADDAALLVPHADTVVVVVRPFFSRSRLVRRVLEMLYQRQAKRVALIFNRARKDDLAGHYAQNGVHQAADKDSPVRC